MRGSWSRWWAYMDELEEVMRISGHHLDEVDRLLSRQYERSTWKDSQRDQVPSEILRRALDIPFLAALIRSARSIDDLDSLEQPDFGGRSWKPDEVGAEQPSLSRAPVQASRSDREAVVDSQPPARVLAAERALQARSRSLVVVLDNLISARNISAVARTTEALGLQELHIIQGQGKPRLERVFTTGSHRWLDLFWYRESTTALSGLRDRGYRVLAADYGETATPAERTPIAGPTALVFGSEQSGVSEAVREQADGLFYLPTAGFTSYLNVSVAVGISLHSFDRRMRESGLRRPLEAHEIEALRPAWYAMLGRGDEARERRYLAWAEQPPLVDVDPGSPGQ